MEPKIPRYWECAPMSVQVPEVSRTSVGRSTRDPLELDGLTARIRKTSLGVNVRLDTYSGPIPDGQYGAGRAPQSQLKRSNGPTCRQHFGLLNHRSRGAVLLVRRIAVLAQDALDETAEVGAHVLAQRPVDGDVGAHGAD